MDGKDVQDGAVPEEAVSSDGTSTPVATPALTKDEVTSMLRDFGEDLSKRLKQSTDDRIKAERGRTPTPDYGSVLGVLGDAEPEVKAKVYEDLIRRTQAQQNQAAQQEQQRAASEQFESDWKDTNQEFVVSLGIDPSDKRLEWGEGRDYLQRQKKLQSSAARLVKEQLEGSTANAKKEAAEKIAQAAVEAGLESNTAVGGGGSSSTKVFTGKQIGEMTYAEYKANEKDIDAATRAGNIK